MAAHYSRNVWICVLAIVLANFINLNAANNETVQSADLVNWLGHSEFGYDFLHHLNSTPAVIETKWNSTCLLQFQMILNGIIRKDEWAFKFVDAWGKFPSGLLHGHFVELGNFDECVRIDEKPNSDNHMVGKYCLSKIPLGTIEVEPHAFELSLKLGICTPAACSAEEVDIIMKEFLNTSLKLNIHESTKVVESSSCTVSDRGPFDALDWIAIGVLSCLGFLMISSTFYDYITTNIGKTLDPLLAAFSVRNNMRHLLRITSHQNSPHVIHCLHGIRCMSIIWIILGHCYVMMVPLPHVNSIDLVKWLQSPSFILLLSDFFSVDSFFFLSGLLLSTLALKALDKTEGKLNVPMMYLHRYLRLTPALALAMLIFVSLYRNIGNGPLWNEFTQPYKSCSETWWSTLLYIQNYANPDNMCMNHAWYLAVDTQLYVISPLVLLLIWKWKKKGVAVLSVIGLLLAACLFSIIMINKLVFFDANGKPVGVEVAVIVMRKIYYATQTRASPWIIGIILGYFMHTNNGRRIQISKKTVLLGWVLSLSLIFTVIFSLYPKTQPDATPITPLECAFYLALSRIAWPLALCWVVFACVNGYGGPINQFLSWSFWQPFSKLTYSIYIWHLFVVIVHAGRFKTNSYFSNYDVILRFWSDFGISICVSLVMYLAIEAPMIGIEKFLFSYKKTSNEEAAVTQSQQKICD